MPKRSKLEETIFKMGQRLSNAVGADTAATRTARAEGKRKKKKKKKYTSR